MLAQEDASRLEAVIDTSKGAITLRFFPKEAPRHVAHFIETARAVLAAENPVAAEETVFHLADEHQKRHGQAVAAASLPELR